MRKRFFEFGPFRIDLALTRLERAGEPLPLPPKAYDLLVLLAAHADRVMSKAELMDALWPNTFVEEANLTQHVYTLRRTLGEQPGGKPYIETVPRRGYRLAAPVREGEDGSGPPASAPAAGTAAAAAPRAVAADGERRHATVLECRLANAAAVVERLGPAALRDVIDGLLRAARASVEKFEGSINEHHVDGFVALFGVPVAHEDDARRAVLAAFEIEASARTLLPEGGAGEEPLRLRIGISSGPLVVSRLRPDSPVSAMGDAVRLANLLQQAASPGTVLIGDLTRRWVDSFIEVAPDHIDVAGAPAFRVLGPGTATGTAGAGERSRRPRAPFVGRSHELALLENIAAQIRDGRGQAVGIVGEPGIGKSRLLHELGLRLPGLIGTVPLEARCLSYGSLAPYLPLADLVRAHCGVADTATPEEIRQAVERTACAYELPPDAGGWLLHLLGVGDAAGAAATLRPEAIKSRTFDALRGLFFRAARRKPLALAVEDVHWIDRTSEEFLASLVERLVAAPLLLLTTYRPGYRPPWLDRSYLTQITLRPLPSADGGRLVDAVVAGRVLPPHVAATIIDKGEGNPFFLEELALAVVERGAEAGGIPDSVHGVLLARIDRLPERTKQVLQSAAVLGREVPLPLLARVWPGDDPAPHVAELCRLEFLYERPGSDEPVFVFKHALTQDVAYDSLLTRTRAEWHRRAAEALLELYGENRDDMAATLAYHYARTDLVDEAVRWLTRAADQAARVYANAEAILHLELAARRLQRMPEGAARDRRMLDVALRHAHSLYFLGRFQESVDILRPHEARLARLDDPGLTAQCAFWLAHMHSRLGDQKRAAENAARAIDAATLAGDAATIGKAHGVLALEGHWSGRTADGLASGREAICLLDGRPEQRWWLGMAHFYVGMNHLLRAEFDEALAAAARADATGREIGDARLQTYAGYLTAWVETTRGHHAEAVTLSRRSCDRAPDRVSRAYAAMVLGLSLIEQGAAAEAVAVLEPTARELEGFGFPQWHGLAAALLADGRRRLGDLECAAALSARALEVTTRAQYWYGAGVAQRVAGRVALARGSSGEAAGLLAQSVATFERIGAPSEAERSRAELAAVAGG